MISTMFATAPAGSLGSGSAAVRPYPGVVVCPTPAPAQGTGLSVASSVTGVRGTARLRQVTPVLVQAPTHRQTENFINDGTTLGNPSSRRSTS